MSNDIKNLFSTISARYDFLNHLLSFNLDRRWRSKTIEAIKFDPEAPIRALDLCAGTMDLSIDFLKHFKKAQVFAIDFSEGMIQSGLPKITPDIEKRIFPLCGDAMQLPIPDSFFDVVFCGYGFRNLDNARLGLLEMKRVLKEGGQILILDFFRPQTLISKLFHGTYNRFVLPLIGGMISKNRKAYNYLRDSIAKFMTTDECEDLMKKTGFSKTTTTNFFLKISSLIVCQG